MDAIMGTLSLDDDNLGQSTPTKNTEDAELILDKTSELSLDDLGDLDGDVKMKDSPAVKKLTFNNISKTPIFQHAHTPARPSPLKTSINLADSPNSQDREFLSDDEVDDTDVVMKEADHSFTRVISKTAHNMFSPTELGARIATSPSPFKANLKHKLEETAQETDESLSDTSSVDHTENDDSDDQVLRNRHSQAKTPSKLSVVRYESSEVDSTQDSETTFDDSTQESQDFKTPAVKTPWGNRPIQFQMHHHHYYPSSTESTPSRYDSQNEIIPLPAPWSKFAEPKAPTPYLISSYLQLLFNVFTSSVAIYILINAIKTVKSDINLKMEEYAADIAMEVSRCTRSYVENKCAPETRVAALEVLCSEWERCMNRDPSTQAGKASVSAETLGLILNSLIEPIGIKAIVVFGVGLITWAFTSNFVFGFVRAKSYYGWNSNGDQQQITWNQQQQQQYNPSTPALLPSGPSQHFTPGGPQNWDYNYTPSR